MLLVAFVSSERRAAEPIIPLKLFRSSVFRVASSLGFLIGLAMFGAIIFIPLFLQLVYGVSPTSSGLRMLPLMARPARRRASSPAARSAGSAATRRSRSPAPRSPRSACSCSRGCEVDTAPWLASVYMLVVGIGIGLVMQVLVLVVQNDAPPRDIGVATSTATFFRSMGGSLGVALFGAIFASRLTSELDDPARRLGRAVLRRREHQPGRRSTRFPPVIRHDFLHAFVDALQPVFLVGAALTAGRVRARLAAARGAAARDDRRRRPGQERRGRRRRAGSRVGQRALIRIVSRLPRGRASTRSASRFSTDAAVPARIAPDRDRSVEPPARAVGQHARAGAAAGAGGREHEQPVALAGADRRDAELGPVRAARGTRSSRRRARTSRGSRSRRARSSTRVPPGSRASTAPACGGPEAAAARAVAPAATLAHLQRQQPEAVAQVVDRAGRTARTASQVRPVPTTAKPPSGGRRPRSRPAAGTSPRSRRRERRGALGGDRERPQRQPVVGDGVHVGVDAVGALALAGDDEQAAVRRQVQRAQPRHRRLRDRQVAPRPRRDTARRPRSSRPPSPPARQTLPSPRPK